MGSAVLTPLPPRSSARIIVTFHLEGGLVEQFGDFPGFGHQRYPLGAERAASS
jgi:hypothetical protein